MPTEEVLGPRKTMFVIVIVVGCFAVLWPRILSPLLLGHSQEQLKPNKFDREAGCCEVVFGTELAVFEIINEVCNYAAHGDGKLSPYAASECRKAVNETCGLDIADFLKRTENVGKTSKLLVDTLKSSNSSCLKEHFGVPVTSFSTHLALNSWTLSDTLKQERPVRGSGPHPALRERGRAIPPGAPASKPVPMPAHMRVRSPLSVYYELDIKPPPIPGMRPPLGSPGGPVPAPKSSMGFVMPIYTICIIVFFVYTLSKILFKRSAAPYEPIRPDPQFRKRVFRDDSRSSPDKLVVSAISGLVAEVRQQVEASYANNQQRQELQENHARQFTNGTILHNTGPVHIVASEYNDLSKEKSPELKVDKVASIKDPIPEEESSMVDIVEDSVKLQENGVEITEKSKESNKSALNIQEEEIDITTDHKIISDIIETVEKIDSVTKLELDTEADQTQLLKEEISVESNSEAKEITDETHMSSDVEETIDATHFKTDTVANGNLKSVSNEPEDLLESENKLSDTDAEETTTEFEKIYSEHREDDFIQLSSNMEDEINDLKKDTEDFLNQESKSDARVDAEQKQTTPELLEEAIKEDSPDVDYNDEQENATVKIMGMEVTAHTADGGAWPAAQQTPTIPLPPIPTHPATQKAPHEASEVQSIFLDTEIPQKSRVLIADCGEDKDEGPAPTSHNSMVVSGKMTLSLIQDATRDTPEREPESTVDDFTTASAVTQPAAEKQDEYSEEEIEEEIEIEEIEEEIEVEETDEEVEVEEDETLPQEEKKTQKEKDAE